MLVIWVAQNGEQPEKSREPSGGSLARWPLRGRTAKSQQPKSAVDPKRTSEPVSTSLDYNVLLCCAAQYGDRRWLSCSFQLPVGQLGLDCSSFFSVLFGRGFATRARKATLLCSASCWHSSSSGDSPTVTSIRIPRRSAYRKGRSTRWPLNRPATGPASRYGP